MYNYATKFNKYFKQFFLIDDTPHKIAAGFALGVFWGIMPGEGILTTLVTAAILRFNRLSATAGVVVSNMWSTFVILPLAALVGGAIFGISPASLSAAFHQSYDQGWLYLLDELVLKQVFGPLLVGYLLISALVALGCYVLVYFIVHNKKTTTNH